MYQVFSAEAVGSFSQSSYVVQSQYCVAGSHSPAFGQTSKIGLHVDGSPRWYGRYWLHLSYITIIASHPSTRPKDSVSSTVLGLPSQSFASRVCGQYAPLMSTIGCTYS